MDTLMCRCDEGNSPNAVMDMVRWKSVTKDEGHKCALLNRKQLNNCVRALMNRKQLNDCVTASVCALMNRKQLNDCMTASACAHTHPLIK